VVKIVTLTSSLTDTSEDGETTVSLGDVVDKLLNEDGLTDTGTAEETNLTTTGIGGKKVDNLNTGREHLSRGRLVLERWGLGVNRSELVGLDRSTLVESVQNGRKVILLELDILFVSINIVKTSIRARIKRQGPMLLSVKILFNFKVSSIAAPIRSLSRQTSDGSTSVR
jgi:hypothetical protein